MSAPRVTVLCLAHNHEAFVTEALASVFGQTFPDFELIVVDNASTDGTAAAIRAALPPGETRVRIVTNTTSVPVCRAVNQGLALARGKYFCLFSADDRLRPEKLRTQVAILDAATEPTVVSCATMLIDGSGKELGAKYVPPEVGKRPIAQILVRENFLYAGAPLAPTESFRAIGGADEQLDYEDWDLWLRLAYRHRWIHLEEIHCDYRRLEGSLWTRLSVGARYQTRILIRRKLLRWPWRISVRAAVALVLDLTRLRASDGVRYRAVRALLLREGPYPDVWLVLLVRGLFGPFLAWLRGGT